MSICHFNKIYITIQTAVERKVCILRINITLCIGNNDCQYISFRFHSRCQVKTESRKTSLMSAQFVSITVNGCHMIRTFQLDILFFSFRRIWQFNLVRTNSSPVIIAPILSVKGIPGMWKCHRSICFSILSELCSCHQCFCSHKNSPFI